MDTTAKPKPRVTPDNRPFWEGCREHVLKLPWCAECERAFLPPAPVCPRCFGERIEWRAASGQGTVSTFVVVHQRWFPAFADDLPYNAAQVELEEGPRLTTSLVGIANEDIVVGLEVEAVFDDMDGDTTLPRFRPREPGRPYAAAPADPDPGSDGAMRLGAGSGSRSSTRRGAPGGPGPRGRGIPESSRRDGT